MGEFKPTIPIPVGPVYPGLTKGGGALIGGGGGGGGGGNAAYRRSIDLEGRGSGGMLLQISFL